MRRYRGVSRAASLMVAMGATFALGWPAPALAAGEYPLTLSVDAQAKTASTSLTTKFTIRVDRLMDQSRWKQATDMLKYNGYAKFYNVLRTLPVVGVLELENRKVELKYAREEGDGGRRLILAADRPLFFLGGPPDKARAGYDLTLVELTLDDKGGATGTMTGAARVKPSPNGIVLDTYSELTIQLTARVNRP